MTAYRCATAARLRRDALLATAPPAPRWLLVEQPGPWGRRAALESRLDPAVGLALGYRAEEARARLALIRRPGRHPDHDGPRAWAWVDSTRGQAWWGRYDDPAELLDRPLGGTAGAASVEPVYLVCAHAKHDVCCALRGRPVTAALADLRPEAVWETSHVGGDRFAANVVVLPTALYYGWVDPADTAALVAATEAGKVLPHLLRGSAALAPAAQAAQGYARVALDESRVDALRPLRTERLAEATWRVTLDGAVVTVRREATAPAQLTCNARRAWPTARWVLLDLA